MDKRKYTKEEIEQVFLLKDGRSDFVDHSRRAFVISVPSVFFWFISLSQAGGIYIVLPQNVSSSSTASNRQAGRYH